MNKGDQNIYLEVEIESKDNNTQENSVRFDSIIEESPTKLSEDVALKEKEEVPAEKT